MGEKKKTETIVLRISKEKKEQFKKLADEIEKKEKKINGHKK